MSAYDISNIKPYALVFAPADISHDMQDFKLLFENDNFMHRRVSQVSELLKCNPQDLFDIKSSKLKLPIMQHASLALAAGMLGIADHIVNSYGVPVVAGGISLGELIAFVVAGSLSVEGLVENILQSRDEPSGKVEEAVAFAFFPSDFNIAGALEGLEVNVAVDYGLVQNNSTQFAMLSGVRSDINIFSTKSPGLLEVLPASKVKAAYHSIFRTKVKNIIESEILDFIVQDPSFPVISCVENLGSITSSKGVISAVCRSQTEKLSVPQLLSELKKYEVSEILAIGPFLRTINLDWPNPTRFIDNLSALQCL